MKLPPISFQPLMHKNQLYQSKQMTKAIDSVKKEIHLCSLQELDNRSEEEISVKVQDSIHIGEEDDPYSNTTKWNFLQDKICTQDVEEECINEITQND